MGNYYLIFLLCLHFVIPVKKEPEKRYSNFISVLISNNLFLKIVLNDFKEFFETEFFSLIIRLCIPTSDFDTFLTLFWTFMM